MEGLDRAEAAVEAAADKLAALAPPPETGGTSQTSTSRGGGAAHGYGHDLLRRELEWLAGMLRFACRLGRARLAHGGEETVANLPAAERRALANEIGRRSEELAPLWLARCRPGGLDDSRARLEAVRRLLS